MPSLGVVGGGGGLILIGLIAWCFHKRSKTQQQPPIASSTAKIASV